MPIIRSHHVIKVECDNINDHFAFAMSDKKSGTLGFTGAPDFYSKSHADCVDLARSKGWIIRHAEVLCPTCAEKE